MNLEIVFHQIGNQQILQQHQTLLGLPCIDLIESQIAPILASNST